jgi:hypothetical protein
MRSGRNFRHFVLDFPNTGGDNAGRLIPLLFWTFHSMSSTSFDTTFERLRRRTFTSHGLSGLGWGCCGALVLLLVLIWMDLVWELSSAFRMAAWGLTTAAAVGLLTWFLMKAAKSARRNVLARQLDETGQTGGQIVTGFELQHSRSAATASLTQGLAELAISQAAALAALVPTTLAIPAKPAQRAGLAASVIAVTFLVVAFFAPHLAYTEWLRFADPFGDHPPYSPTQFTIEPGDTQVRYGDGLDVIVQVAGPSVDELELVLRTSADGKTSRDEKLPMFFDSVGNWRATISAVTMPGKYFVQSRSTRSHRHEMGVITVPQIESVRFRITPPAYTRDAVFEGPLPQGGISALAGSKVEVRAISNRPLKSGSIDLVNGDKRENVELASVTSDGTSHEVQGEWTIADAGSFHLNVTDVAGQQSRDSFSGTINLLEDQIPMVRIVEPLAQSIATPNVTIPVVISAEDDYGVTKLQLYRSLNDSRAMPLSIELPVPPPRRHEQIIELPLSAYGLQPGDVIKLFARAEDNDPALAKGSESSVVVIQIISDEELQRMVRAREGVDALVSKYQQAQRRMEALQEEIETLQKQLEKRDADGELSEQEREQLETLSKRMSDEAEAIREAAKHKLPYDLDKALNDELEQLSQKIQKSADEVAKAAASKPSAGKAASKLNELKEQLAQERNEFKEQVNDPLERLAEIYPLLEDQNRFEELVYRQKDLAERLASLKKQENPNDPAIKARMRELESEQRRNREDLDQLLNDIESHAQRLPTDDPKLQKLAKSSLDFVEEVRKSGAGTAMSDAELGLGEFSGERGHREAKNAADILEKFMSKCKGNGQQCEGACDGLKFGPGEGSMGDTLNQLLRDAGFKPGGKPGQNGQTGSGGGYSARRSATRNIGMYGNIPTRGNPQSSASSGSKASQSVGGSYRTDTNQSPSSRLDPHGLLKSSGVSETAVPARYRGRVQEYFQRIAEEAGQKK